MDLENALNQFLEDKRENNYGSQFLSFPRLCNALVQHMAAHIDNVQISPQQFAQYQWSFEDYNAFLQSTKAFFASPGFDSLLQAAQTGLGEDLKVSAQLAQEQQARFQELKQDLERLKALKDEVDQISRNITEYQQEKAALESLDQLTRLRDDLKKRQDILLREHPHLIEDLSRLRQLEQQIGGSVSALQNTYKELLTSADGKHKQLLSELSATEEEINAVNESIKTTTTRIDELREQNHTLQRAQTEKLASIKTYTEVNQRLVNAFGPDAHKLKDKLNRIEHDLSLVDDDIRGLSQ